MRQSVARRSLIRSWCGEKVSYGSVSQSGNRQQRKPGAKNAISSMRRCASVASAVTMAVSLRSALARAATLASSSASAEPGGRGSVNLFPGLSLGKSMKNRRHPAPEEGGVHAPILEWTPWPRVTATPFPVSTPWSRVPAPAAAPARQVPNSTSASPASRWSGTRSPHLPPSSASPGPSSSWRRETDSSNATPPRPSSCRAAARRAPPAWPTACTS